MASLGSQDGCAAPILMSETPKVGKHWVGGGVGGRRHLVIPTSSCVQFPGSFPNEFLGVGGGVGRGLLLTAQWGLLRWVHFLPPCSRAPGPAQVLPSLPRPPVLSSHL